MLFYLYNIKHTSCCNLTGWPDRNDKNNIGN